MRYQHHQQFVATAPAIELAKEGIPAAAKAPEATTEKGYPYAAAKP